MNAKTAMRMSKDLAGKYKLHVAIQQRCCTYIHPERLEAKTEYWFYIAEVFSTHVNTWAEVVALYDKYMEEPR